MEDDRLLCGWCGAPAVPLDNISAGSRTVDMPCCPEHREDTITLERDLDVMTRGMWKTGTIFREFQTVRDVMQEPPPEPGVGWTLF